MQAQGLLAALVAGHAADLVIDAVALSIVPILEQLPACMHSVRQPIKMLGDKFRECHQGLRCKFWSAFRYMQERLPGLLVVTKKLDVLLCVNLLLCDDCAAVCGVQYSLVLRQKLYAQGEKAATKHPSPELLAVKGAWAHRGDQGEGTAAFSPACQPGLARFRCNSTPACLPDGLTFAWGRLPAPGLLCSPLGRVVAAEWLENASVPSDVAGCSAVEGRTTPQALIRKQKALNGHKFRH